MIRRHVIECEEDSYAPLPSSTHDFPPPSPTTLAIPCKYPTFPCTYLGNFKVPLNDGSLRLGQNVPDTPVSLRVESKIGKLMKQKAQNQLWQGLIATKQNKPRQKLKKHLTNQDHDVSGRHPRADQYLAPPYASPLSRQDSGLELWKNN